MLDKILEFKKNHPVVFWVLLVVLLPLVIVWGVTRFSMSMIAHKARQDEAEAQLKDAALKKAMDGYKIDAAKEQQKAEDLAKQAADVQVGEDWNLKK